MFLAGHVWADLARVSAAATAAAAISSRQLLAAVAAASSVETQLAWQICTASGDVSFPETSLPEQLSHWLPFYLIGF